MPVLTGVVVDVMLATGLKAAGEDTGPRDDPWQGELLAAIGVDAKAIEEASLATSFRDHIEAMQRAGSLIVEAIKSGLKADPSGFRSRVLAAANRPRESPCRYDPVAKLWITKGVWWLEPGQWERSVETVAWTPAKS